MEFIISKGYGEKLPDDKLKMEQTLWFNMWRKKNFPYQKLVEGDIIYWLDTTKNQLKWKTKVTRVVRFPYSDKKDIWKLYKDSMTSKYYESRSIEGYFLYYEIKVIEKIDGIFKPSGHNFPRLGWEELDEENMLKWFGGTSNDDVTVLDDSIKSAKDSLNEMINELNKKMQYVSPQRVNKLVNMTIRKDTRFVKMLKESANYKCQFPSCEQQIKTEKGNFYVEVAHIKAVKNGGQSMLGNLLVLCPNHHKEFDLGKKENIKQFQNKLSGFLNDKEFEITLIY